MIKVQKQQFDNLIECTSFPFRAKDQVKGTKEAESFPFTAQNAFKSTKNLVGRGSHEGLI
ncbi:hypothetical protein [Alkalihalobacillus sp. AL-G]|uniref:hypothetical protein n=1 Tax=Alkalihalobacillus sp. AL-G TaxID=2926399 RepID=UPI00272B55B1|nr:hypothetical protein [Alkalihalobacillus sp. AL-G]WLD93466.1 hypothetical protein MOJ78_00435 [Alkalihalobacillus sp. AL-G]